MTETQSIFAYLETEYNSEPSVIQDRIAKLNIYLARSAQIMAEAERDLAEAKAIKIQQALEIYPSLQASVFNELVKSKLKDEQYTYTLANRLNSAIVHTLDSLRSQLSFMKAEIFNN